MDLCHEGTCPGIAHKHDADITPIVRTALSPALDHRRCWMTRWWAQTRPSWQRPGRPKGRHRRRMVDIALVLRDGGLRRLEAAAAVLVWSDIERWDDGSGLLLVEQSNTDQTGEGEQDCSDGDASLPSRAPVQASSSAVIMYSSMSAPHMCQVQASRPTA